MKNVGFAVSWLAMTVVIAVLNALVTRRPTEVADERPGAARARPTPPPALRQ